MISAVDHINIVTRDIAESTRFYTELLGLTVTRRAHLEGAWIDAVVGLQGARAEVVYVQPPGGGPRIELIQYHAPPGADCPACATANTLGLRHIAFRVADIEGTYARLQAAGVPFLSPPADVPESVVRHDDGRKRLCYFHDPDGVILELAEYVPSS